MLTGAHPRAETDDVGHTIEIYWLRVCRWRKEIAFAV